jgi:hypothetical protein
MVNFNDYGIYKYTDTSGEYRNYYEPLNISFDKSDIYYIVPSEYNQKPGNLANKLYGSPQFSWVFMYFNRNTISDPIFDLKEGLIIRIPTKKRLLSFF